MQLQIVQPVPHKAEVLSALSTCRVLYFVGHSGTKPESPLQSKLLLKDWIEDPLMVESVFQTNLTFDPPFFA